MDNGSTRTLTVTAPSAVLLDDAISVDTVTVDPTHSAPLAPFRNPALGHLPLSAQSEALFLAPDGDTPILTYAQRKPDTGNGDSNWQTTPLFGGASATAVAAGFMVGVGDQPLVRGWFANDEGFHATGFAPTDGQPQPSWDGPTTLDSNSVLSLKTAYTPENFVVAYGPSADGSLVLSYGDQVGVPSFAKITLDAKLTDQDRLSLVMSDTHTWHLLVVNGDNQLAYYQGDVTDTSNTSPSHISVEGGFTPVDVLVGYFSQRIISFIAIGKDGSLATVTPGGEVAATPLALPSGIQVAKGTAQVGVDGRMQVYIVDQLSRLWVFRQFYAEGDGDLNGSWTDGGAPVWAPPLPLTDGVAYAIGEFSQSLDTHLFSCDDDGTVSHHAKELVTAPWRSRALHLDPQQSTPIKINRYHLEFTASDQYGSPYPLDADGNPTKLRLATAADDTVVEFQIGGQAVVVGPRQAAADGQDYSVEVATNEYAKVALAVPANGSLSLPSINVLDPDSGQVLCTANVGQPAQNYLNGNGTLRPENPLPPFDADGGALSAGNGAGAFQLTTTDPTTLGQAAGYVQQGAGLGLQQEAAGPSSSPRRSRPPGPAPGAGAPGSIASLWGDVTHFGEDVLHGIENGISALEQDSIEIVDNVVSFALKIADDVYQGMQYVIEGIADAAKFIGGLLQNLIKDFEDFINWLKSLFDWTAIWHTKIVFENVIADVPRLVTAVTDKVKDDVDKFFAKEKKQIDDDFKRLIADYSDSTFTSFAGWQTAGQSGQVGNTSAQTGDYTNNAHANWMANKVSSSGGVSFGDPSLDQSLAQTLSDEFKQYKDKLEGDFNTFIGAVEDFFSSPNASGGAKIADLLTAVQALIDAILDTINALADASLDVFADMVSALGDVLTATITVPDILQDLWNWLAEEAGYGDDADQKEITLAALISLVLALPVTIGYKIIAGADQEPFPDPTAWPNSGAAAPAGGAPAVDSQLLAQIAGGLTIFSVIPHGYQDIAGDDKTPGFIKGLNYVLTAITLGMTTGLPEVVDLAEDPELIPAVLLAGGVAAAAAVYVLKNEVIAYAVQGCMVGWAAYCFSTTLHNIKTGAVQGAQAAVGILAPLPGILTGAIKLEDLNKNEAGAIAVGIIDFVGYVGGGACEIFAHESTSSQGGTA